MSGKLIHKQILIRVDASRQIGTGHVMRCLTLALALREAGASVQFVCREHDGHLCDLLVARGFVVLRLPPLGQTLPSDAGFGGFSAEAAFSPERGTSQLVSAHAGAGNAGSVDATTHAAWLGCDWTLDAAQSVALLALLPQRADWLIVDHYAIDQRWQRVLRSHVGQIMVIDDLADRQHDCDLLLDQNLMADMASRYARRVPAACTCLLGPQYALLQANYAELRAQRKERQNPPQRIFAFFGGFDPANLSGLALEVFLALCRSLPPLQAGQLQLDLVLPAQHAQVFEIEKLAHAHPQVHLYRQLPSLAPLLAVADLAVGAGGTTSWERLCLGVPALIVTVAANQRPGAEEQQAQGLLHILADLDPANLSENGRERLRADLLAALQQVLTLGVAALVPGEVGNLVDGHGATRVSEKLLQQLPESLQLHLSQAREATPARSDSIGEGA